MDPILYYTELEIVSYAMGRGEGDSKDDKCGKAITSTSVLDLPVPVNFPTDFVGNVNPLESLLSVPTPTGTIDSRFGQSVADDLRDCALGVWTAPQPTMVVVVEVTYDRGFVVLVVHQEHPATGELDGPQPTSSNNESQNHQASPTVTGTTTTSPQPGFNGGNLVTPNLVFFDRTFAPGEGDAEFIVGGQTIGPGDVATVSGKTITLGPGPTPTVVVMDGQTQLLGVATQGASLTIAGTAVPQRPDGSFVFGDVTVVPGRETMIYGTTVSLASNPTYVAVNGAMSSLAPTTMRLLTLGSNVYPATTISWGQYLISGQLLTQGGTVTISGSTISLGAGASYVVVNGQTQYLAGFAPLTIGGTTFSARSGTYSFGSTTLAPGQSAVVDGTTLVVLAGGTVVVNGHRSTVGPQASNIALPTTTSMSGSVMSATASGASQTLTKHSSGARSNKMTVGTVIGSWMVMAFLGGWSGA